MTEAHIKEELSRIFISSLAAFKGYAVSKPDKDYGVDLRIEVIERYRINGKTRFTQLGQSVDVQLKATSKKIDIDKDFLKFDLAVENYNDLILRRESLKSLAGGHTPLFLIVFFLPENNLDWLQLDDKGMFLGGSAFWYYPPEESEISTNIGTQRIKIPLGNRVNFDFFDNVFNLYKF